MVINVKRPPNIYYYKLYLNLVFDSDIVTFHDHIPIKFTLLTEFKTYNQQCDKVPFIPSIINKIIRYNANYNYSVKEIIKIFNVFRKKNLEFIPSLIKVCSKDLLCIPFWNAYTKLLSDKLYLPTLNDLVKTINKTLDNSWFKANEFVNNKNAYKLNFKKVNYEECILTKTRKINIYFNKSQKKYMRQIIGIYRYFYNRCVSFLNNYDKKTRISKYYINSKNKMSLIIVKVPETINPYSFISMRPILKQHIPTWLLKDFPEHLIDQALNEAFVRFKICLDRCIKTGKQFEFKYKQSKENVHTINLEKSMIHKTNSLFRNWKINDNYLFRNLKTSERFHMYNFKGSTLSYHRILKKYTLNLSYEEKTYKHYIPHRIGAGDPGQRTFLTIYSTDKVIEVGNNGCNKLFNICKEIDIIQSRLNCKEYYTQINNEKIIYKMNHNRRRNLKKALHNKIQYLKNLKTELHNKSIKYICDNYSTIILPPYEIQNMVGKLHSVIARGMYNLAYYTFREKLVAKSKEYNIKVLIKPEYYTTKTCGQCGILNHNIGTNKVFNCPICKLEMGRDQNAARNNLLRNIKYT
ncbi:transposase [Klosneuvirus KNV1]|uniref:Transposase n=1 Tax=Klosneuvirus KNV1 TaxID=1977640 RepID=A0A1V0SIW2_9VIRU|nr:transposase [Klosneuvirus KNV1]